MELADFDPLPEDDKVVGDHDGLERPHEIQNDAAAARNVEEAL
jgi:hypothetical protein